MKVSFRVAREQILKILYFQFVLFTRFMKSKFKMVSLRGQKEVGPRPDSSPLGGLISNFRRTSPPLSYGSPPQSLFSPDRALTILLLFIPWYRKEFLPYLDESFKEVLKLVQVGKLKGAVSRNLSKFKQWELSPNWVKHKNNHSKNEKRYK